MNASAAAQAQAYGQVYAQHQQTQFAQPQSHSQYQTSGYPQQQEMGAHQAGAGGSGFASPSMGAPNGGPPQTNKTASAGFTWSEEHAPPPRRQFPKPQRPETEPTTPSTTASATRFLTSRGAMIWGGLVAVKDFVVEKWNSALAYFELFPEDAKIVFFGLDNAGKTTLLGVLHNERMGVHMPTGTPQHGSFKHKGRRIDAIDMGGHETARRLWKDYAHGCDAVFFLVDAADRTRIQEAREELHRLFEMEALENVPIAVLGNKIDKCTAMSPDEFQHWLALPFPTVHGPNNAYQYGYRANSRGEICGPVGCFMCSLLHRMGYKEAFEYVSDVMKKSGAKKR